MPFLCMFNISMKMLLVTAVADIFGNKTSVVLFSWKISTYFID